VGVSQSGTWAPDWVADRLGPAIRVRDKSCLCGLIPGKIVTTAFRKDTIKKTSWDKKGDYATAEYELFFEPECSDDRLRKRLTETLDADFESLKASLEREGTTIVETLYGF
jgi:hypothetical protein